LPDPKAAPAVEDDVADDDLGADLEAHWDAAEASEDSLETGTDTPSASVSTSSASSPAETGVDVGRARGPDGKFTKADPKAVAPAEFKIPEKWPAQVKQELSAIHAVNPAHAKFLLDQYNFMRNEASQALNRAQQEGQAHLKVYNDLLAPGRQQRALQGMDDSTYVRNLIAAGDVLDKNPEQGLRWLAQRYGVDIQKLANPQQAGQQPEIPEWAQRVQQENHAIRQFIAQQAQGQEQQKLQQASDWINQFASQKNDQGQALYPHFDAVLDELIVNVDYQMRSGQPVDVKAAYERAVRMNDSVWQREAAARTEASRKDAEARKKRDLLDAKRAGFSVSGSGADTSKAVPDDLGENLARNWENLSRS
jgi:hypothetical protein